MSAFDAAVLLVADGMVAVGRVLGGLRRRCAAEKHADALAEAEESRDSWEPDELWTLPPNPAADMTPEKWGFVGKCPNRGRMCNCTGECITPPKRDGAQLGRSAAVSTPAADNTPEHLEAAYNYHRPAANYNGDLVWGCEGCNWHGATIQAHSRHRFQVLADMTAATGRVQQKLGGTG